MCVPPGRGCRAERKRLPFSPGTCMFTLAALLSPWGNGEGSRGLHEKWHLPKTCQFLGHLRGDSLKHQRHLNKNSTFLKASSFIMMY